MSPTSLKLAPLALALAAVLAPKPAASQVPTNPFDYSRESTTTYESGTNRVSTHTESSAFAAGCNKTTFEYDSFGNVKKRTISNCTGATGDAPFTSRSTSQDFSASTVAILANGSSVNVAVPAGLAPTQSSNALNQSTSYQVDPRFGVQTQKQGPNTADLLKVTVDDFGRTTRGTNPDGTSTLTKYCVLASSGLNTSSNSPECPVPTSVELPVGAVSFVHSEPRSTDDKKMGPFVRVFFDRLGRAIRTSTESFDGANQPAARKAAVVVQDTVYSVNGVKALETGPYFAASGASSTTGSQAVGVSLMQYDALGRVVSVSRTDKAAKNQSSVTFGGAGATTYGVYGARTAAVDKTSYSGLKTTVQNDKGNSRALEANTLGMATRVTDEEGAQLAYQYDAFGNLIKVVDALQNTTQFGVDTAGRTLTKKDPDKGLWTYKYNALAEVTSHQSPKQLAAAQVTTFSYDLLGRLASRTEPEYRTDWYYDAYKDGTSCAQGIGRLCEVTTSAGLSDKRYYDSKGRLSSERRDLTGGYSFASVQTYTSTTGRLASKTFPTGLTLGYGYTAGLGILESVRLDTAVTVQPLPAVAGGTAGAPKTMAAGTNIWVAHQRDAAGQIERYAVPYVYVNRTRDDSTGRVISITAGSTPTGANLSSYALTWDSLGNLTGKTDSLGDGVNGAVTDTFQYDNLNRLAQYDVAGTKILPNFSRTVKFQYNALGSMLSKSDVGNYSYETSGASSTRPHFMKSISGSTNATFTPDANGNVAAATGGKYSSLTYTSFDNVKAATGSAATYEWQYDADHMRAREDRTVASGAGAGVRKTFYLHPDAVGGLAFEYEVDTPTTPSAAYPTVSHSRHYINTDVGTVGVLVTHGAIPALAAGATSPASLSSATLTKSEYWLKDHLGSVVATTDHLGQVTRRYSYDPFGKRRYPTGAYDTAGAVQGDWSPAVNSGTDRGFTGHEQLDDIGIVNMNGRIYDANVGRFLQPDRFVKEPDNLQDYNRYTYLSNNPLNSTDPSGFVSAGTGGTSFTEWLFRLFGAGDTPAAPAPSTNSSGGAPTVSVAQGDVPLNPIPLAEAVAPSDTPIQRVEVVGSRIQTHKSPSESFIAGWGFNNDPNEKAPQLDWWKAGLAARMAAGVLVDMPEDFSTASTGDIVMMASNFVPVGKLGKLGKLLAAGSDAEKDLAKAAESAARVANHAKPPGWTGLRLHESSGYGVFQFRGARGGYFLFEETSYGVKISDAYRREETASGTELLLDAFAMAGIHQPRTIVATHIQGEAFYKQLAVGGPLSETMHGAYLNKVVNAMGGTVTSMKAELREPGMADIYVKISYP